MVLIEPAGFEEQSPLLATEQHRASAVGPQQRQNRVSLGNRQIGRQEVSAMHGRMLRLRAGHQAALVRKP